MLPLKISLYLLVGLAFVVAENKIGEIAEDSMYYRSSLNPNRSELPRVIQPAGRIPQPVPRPHFIQTLNPEPRTTVPEVPALVISPTPGPLAGSQPHSRPNFTFSRPSLGSRPTTYPSANSLNQISTLPSNNPSTYIPSRPKPGFSSRQPIYPLVSTPANVVNNAPIIEPQKEYVARSPNINYRPILTARPIPRPSNVGVIFPVDPITQPAILNEPVPTEIPISTSMSEEPEVGPQELLPNKDVAVTVTKAPQLIAPITPDTVTVPANPINWRPHQRPTLSVRPIPRPTFNGIVTTSQRLPEVTIPIGYVTSPSSLAIEPQPTEIVPITNSKLEPIETLPSSSTPSPTTYLPAVTVAPEPELIPKSDPEILNNIPSSTALPDNTLPEDTLVIIPQPKPASSQMPVLKPRPNDQYWRPNPILPVPIQPQPIPKPQTPPSGRYPPVKLQPDSRPPIVSKPRPTSKPTVIPMPTTPTASVTPGNVWNMRCERENGYYARQECDSYVECNSNVATEYLCSDGLHFNPNAVWPEYPCAYPSEVQCLGKPNQQANPTSECPRQYGYFAIKGDCSKYLTCQEGLATVMKCPPGLVYNDAISACDWPEQVPSCKPEVFQGFTCLPVLEGEDPDTIKNYKYGNSCKNYVACQRGSPRLLSCDEGFSFDSYAGYCVQSDYVENCAGFL